MASYLLGIVSLVLILVALTAFPGALADEIYRWRDAHGVLHFSDAPPGSGDADLLLSTPRSEPTRTKGVRPPTATPDALPKGMLWRIESGRSAPSFLLGTIHSSDPRVLQWPAKVNDALKHARCLVMEMTLESDTFFKLGSAMMFTDDHDIADLLGPSDYRRLRVAMADQPLPENFLRKMKPWVLMAMLSQPGSGSKEFMDMRLYRRALGDGKRVFGLETVDEQLAVFEGMTMEDQVALLKAALDQAEELPGMTAQMVDTYLTGDLEALAALAEAFAQKDNSALQARFMRRLNDERNERMVERLLPRIEEGGAFIAVGALHLAGPTGLIRQLSKRGCRLTPVN